jgi:hypothetical protein
MDGPKWYKAKFTNVSDGTGETAVTKVDVSAMSGSPTRVSVSSIDFATYAMGVGIYWDAATDALIHTLPADSNGTIRNIPGAPPDNVTANTGDILFTTRGAASGDSYSVTLTLRKKYS